MLVLLAACASVGGLLLAELLRPGGLTFAGSLGGAGLMKPAGLLAFAVLTAATLAGLSFVLHRRWRAADAEFAKRLGARARWGTLAERVARRVCGGRGRVGAQLARDLQLTLRGFSSAGYVAAGVAARLVGSPLPVFVGGGAPPGGGAGGAAAARGPPRRR